MSSAVEILIKTAYQGQGAAAAKVDLSGIKSLGFGDVADSWDWRGIVEACQ